MKREEIRSLTGIRGIAALAVVLHHFLPQASTAMNPVRVVINNAYLAVDLFFLLSGFVLAMTHGHFFARSPTWRDYGNYLRKRFARTYPLYGISTVAAFLILFAGLHSPMERQHLWSTLVANLMLVQTWQSTYKTILIPGWSISTEWAAYFLFPVLILAGLRTKPVTAGILSCIACAAVISISLASETWLDEYGWRRGPLDITSTATAAPLLRCLGEFFLGIVVFRLSEAKKPDIAGLVKPLLVNLAAGAALGLMALRGLDVIVVAMFAATILGLSVDKKSMTTRALSWSPVYGLGLISYSVYLVHWPVLEIADIYFKPHGGLYKMGTASALLLAAAVIPFSTLTYLGIEKPMRKWLMPSR